MFGSRAKELESLLVSTKLELEKMTEEKKKLEKELDNTRSELSRMKAAIGESGVQALEEKLKETTAEYEGLKDLYNSKVREFDNSREEAEQDFAREAALKRHHLENEIADTKQASQQFISSTVHTFSETYNYYLNQIKVLMDALGQVAEETGRNLFQNDTENLKVNFSQQLAEALKSGTDTLAGEDGDLIVIGASEEDVDMLEVRATEPETEAEAQTAPETEKTIPEKDGEKDKENADEISREIEKALDGNF